MMPRVHIRIDGSTDSTSRRRLKEELERAGSAASGGSPMGGFSAKTRGGFSAKTLMVVIGAAAVVYSTSGGSPPAVLLDGTEFRAFRVAVLRDSSPSMSNQQDRLQRRLGELRAGGVAIDRVTDVDEGASVGALLAALRLILPELPGVDAIYFFSDFQDRNDPDDFIQLRQLLDSRGLRLYIATVELPPATEWTEAALQSGGGVLVPRR